MIDIYLACPYSDPDPNVRQHRFDIVNKFAARLMKERLTVFSPISHTHPIAQYGLPLGWDFWEHFDREFLFMCRVMIVLTINGWVESKGVGQEVRIFKSMKRSIFSLMPDDDLQRVCEFCMEHSSG
jgi:hypothetical protein